MTEAGMDPQSEGREGDRRPTGQLPFKYTFTEKIFEIVKNLSFAKTQVVEKIERIFSTAQGCSYYQNSYKLNSK